MKLKENCINILSSVIPDGMKIVDEQNLLKDFMNDNDEILSASSWGKLIQYLGKKSFEIKDFDEAYHFVIYTSFTSTVFQALERYCITINNLAVPNSSNLDYSYKEFYIDNILKNGLVKYYQRIYKTLFKKQNISDDDIKLLIKYINNNLKYNYFTLLNKNPLTLTKYINHLKSDTFNIEKNNFQKELYETEIEKEYQDIVLNDEKGLTLKDLYIEPYFRVHQNCFKDDDKRIEERRHRDSKFADIKKINIHKFITSILDNKNELDLKNDDIDTIFISGFPGQGKSSFVKRLIYDVLNENISISEDIVLIKLKNIKEPKSLINGNIEEVIKEQIPYKIENLDNYIIVLDGLDELYMKSGLKLSDIDEICAKISRINAKTIVTTRHHYVNFDKLNEKNILTIELKELDMIQQKKWLGKYKKTYPNKKLSNEIIEQLHSKRKKNRHILELINQPILLHMIAEMDIDNIEELDKNKLYKEFFDILIERKWEKDQHTLFEGMDKKVYTKSLRNMLQELALNIFQSQHEYIHKIDFEQLQSVKKFKNELEKVQNNSLQDGLKGVMIAFYFQEVKKETSDKNRKELQEDYAIEFLHKSLMEYMVAENIWYTMRKFLGKDSISEDYSIIDNKQALELIWDLFNKKLLSQEIVKNIIEIIQNNTNQEEKDELFDRLLSFMNYFLEKDFIYISTLEDKNPIDKSISTFYGFWTILSHLNNMNCVTEKNKNKIVKMIKLFKSIYSERNLNLSNNDFSEINFSDISFRNENISNSNFTNSILDNISLYETNIYNIILNNTTLNYSDIWEMDINDIVFIDSKINFSTLFSCRFYDVTIENTDFSNSQIYCSEFKDAKINNVDFRGTVFNEGLSSACIFENVEFIDCFFKDTIFYNTEFINCKGIDNLEEMGAIVINNKENE